MANKIYRAVESSITFQDSGGDVVITLANLGYGAGRISDRYDRGAGSKPMRYKWKAVIQFESNPAVGQTVELYIAESDGTYVDGNVGTSDGQLTSDKRRNLTLIGLVVVDVGTAGTNIIASGVCHIWERYFSLGVWNATANANLKNTANASRVIFTPMPDEVQ